LIAHLGDERKVGHRCADAPIANTGDFGTEFGKNIFGRIYTGDG